MRIITDEEIEKHLIKCLDRKSKKDMEAQGVNVFDYLSKQLDGEPEAIKEATRQVMAGYLSFRGLI